MRRCIQLSLALGFAALLAADLTADGKRWWSHVEFLASDALEGRNTGSPGYRKAADYVAGEFERAGLKPAGTSGPFQTVQFESRVVDEPSSSLALVRDGATQPLTIGDDAVIGLRGNPPAAEFEAPLYFVGYGLVVPEHNYNDFEGLDLRGKIVVSVSGSPEHLPGPLVSHSRTARAVAPHLKKAGIAGVVGVPNPKIMDVPWDRAKLARVMPSMGLADPSMQESANLQISLTLNPASLDKQLEGSGHTTAKLMALATARKPLPRFPLKGTLRSKVAVRTSTAEAPNVIGLLPGSDPKLKNEYVVISAHLDHVGVGAPINGDKIYNGAMDNASGAATLIETARTMKGRKLARSVLFVALCGEEKGLLGSRYFAERFPVEGGRMVANINLDMFLPLHELQRLVVYGLDESTLAAPVQAVAKEFQVAVDRDPEPLRNLFIRSDQYSFIRQGVPALAFKFGYLPNSPEEKLHKEWLRTRYHAPSDDLQQPVHREAAATFNRMMAALLERVANAPEAPKWNDNSFFRRFAAQ